MKFEEAMEAMRNGKHARLATWTSDMVIYMKDSMIFCLHIGSNNQIIHWPIDICREDWEVLA